LAPHPRDDVVYISPPAVDAERSCTVTVLTGTAIPRRVSARRARQGVLFTVTDNGPGIPSEYHDLIFRKFGQVEMPRHPRTRSSGLGLTFCKLVVERHGGRIWVKSAEGSGSSFYIELPSDPTATGSD
jgi:signal transduction histidine kinase